MDTYVTDTHAKTDIEEQVEEYLSSDVVARVDPATRSAIPVLCCPLGKPGGFTTAFRRGPAGEQLPHGLWAGLAPEAFEKAIAVSHWLGHVAERNLNFFGETLSVV